jgi:GNAT superfamily N-acetyltransferase
VSTRLDAIAFNDHALAQRLEDAETASTLDYVNTHAHLRPDGGSFVHAIGDGLAVYVGPDSPINRVHGLGMHGSITAADLTAVEDFYAARSATPRIDLCPLAHTSLREALLRQCYGVVLFKHVWWRTLDDFALAAVPADAHLRIEMVDADEYLHWAQVVSAGFSGATQLDGVDVDIPLTNAHKVATRCFLATVGDTPAGGGALAIHDGVALCFSASTRPAYRRLGIQRALLAARLAYAADAGCDLAAVSTIPGSASQRNVERLGFRLAYTKATVGRG